MRILPWCRGCQCSSWNSMYRPKIPHFECLGIQRHQGHWQQRSTTMEQTYLEWSIWKLMKVDKMGIVEDVMSASYRFRRSLKLISTISITCPEIIWYCIIGRKTYHVTTRWVATYSVLLTILSYIYSRTVSANGTLPLWTSSLPFPAPAKSLAVTPLGPHTCESSFDSPLAPIDRLYRPHRSKAFEWRAEICIGILYHVDMRLRVSVPWYISLVPVCSVSHLNFWTTTHCCRWS